MIRLTELDRRGRCASPKLLRYRHTEPGRRWVIALELRPSGGCRVERCWRLSYKTEKILSEFENVQEQNLIF